MLKFQIIRKFFKHGMQDKTQAAINMIYFKNSDEKFLNLLGSSLPVASELLKNDKCLSEICSSIDVQFRNSMKGLIKKNTSIETDCSICFHNFSNDNNPIIYCSGYVYEYAYL